MTGASSGIIDKASAPFAVNVSVITGTLPVTNGGTGTATAFTQGSVVFAGPSGVYAQDNANLFWNNTSKSLTVGGFNTATSQIRAGSLEMQSFALNNAWYGENIFFNGSNFTYRATGGASLLSFRGNEITARCAVSGTAGATATMVVPFKANADGTCAIGGNISTSVGSYSSAAIIANLSSILLGATSTPSIQTNKPMFAIGDSITVGNGASPSSASYVNLIIAATGSNVSNLAVGGTEIQDQARSQVYPQTVIGTTQSFILPGYNNMRRTGTDGTGLTTYSNALMAALTWLAVPDANRIYAQNVAISYTGTWTNTTPYGSVLGKFTSTNGATASATVYGTAVYIGYVSYPGLPAGTMTVSIDGVSYGTIDESVGTAPASAIAYWPGVFRVGGLSEGPHSVVLTVTSAGGTNVYLDYIATNATSNQIANPRVFVGNTLRMNSTGYALSGPDYNHGSNAAVALFNAVNAKTIAALASDGLSVVAINPCRNYNPDSGDVSADNTHPNNTGHSNIAKAFLMGMNQIVMPGDREGAVIASVPSFLTNTKTTLIASTVSAASLNIPVGVAPTAPADGDIWREDNTNTGLKVRINGVTKTVTVS